MHSGDITFMSFQEFKNLVTDESLKLSYEASFISNILTSPEPLLSLCVLTYYPADNIKI